MYLWMLYLLCCGVWFLLQIAAFFNLISFVRKLIGVVETGEKPLVHIYDSKTYKKKRVITVPTDKGEICNSTKFAAITFTYDSKYLIAVSGEPDWLLYYFKCDKGKLESTARANNANGTGSVLAIACSPVDINQLILVGDSLLRMMQCNDHQWKQFGYSKSEQLVFTSAIWLTQDRILTGTKNGKLLFLESGELKAVFNANDLTVMNLKIKEDAQQVSQTSLTDMGSVNPEEGQSYAIKYLKIFSRGFAFAYLHGTVHLFEKETPHVYRKRNVFKIPDHTIVREYEKASNEVKKKSAS